MQTIIVKENFKDMDKLNNLAKEAFPTGEYFPPEDTIKIKNSNLYALYDNDLFIGYMAIKTFKNMAYLFFLAIDSNLRSKGYGGQALKEFRKLYPNYQLVLDLELIDESAKNNNQRIRRKDFYIKNGYKKTGKGVYYFGVYYEILCIDENMNLDLFKEMLKEVKSEKPNFNPKYFDIRRS